MTASAVNLCNQALRLLGDASIASFEEGTDLAETCSTLYVDTTRSLLTAYPWRFTLAKKRLARLADAPAAEWTYAHMLPPARLMLRGLSASGAVGAPPITDFEIFEDQAWSNSPELWADYQTERDAETWPPYFRNLARHALAAVLAVATTNSADQSDYWRRVTYGGTRQDGTALPSLMAEAQRLDAQQQRPQPLNPLVQEALRMIGLDPVRANAESQAITDAALALYQPTVDNLLTAYPWRFTLTKAKLTRAAEAPVSEWPYQHDLPADCLVLRQVMASPELHARPVTSYEVFSGKILCDAPDLWADYQARRDPITWPAAFRLLARYALAAERAPTAGASTAQAEAFRTRAFGTPGQNGNGGQMAVARSLDSQQQPGPELDTSELIGARFGRR